MKRASRMVWILALLVVPILFATKASAQTGPVPGVYENFTVGKESGDLEGMRVVLIPAGGGHHAVVQIAQGGAEDPKPVFVDVIVKGATVEFTVNDQKYRGTVSIAGLSLRDPEGKTYVLKRRPCATLFR
jgi:hypothetical protein